MNEIVHILPIYIHLEKNTPARVTIPGHLISGLNCRKQGGVHFIIGLGQGGQIVGNT